MQCRKLADAFSGVYCSSDEGSFHRLRPKVDRLRQKHVKVSAIECVCYDSYKAFTRELEGSYGGCSTSHVSYKHASIAAEVISLIVGGTQSGVRERERRDSRLLLRVQSRSIKRESIKQEGKKERIHIPTLIHARSLHPAINHDKAPRQPRRSSQSPRPVR